MEEKELFVKNFQKQANFLEESIRQTFSENKAVNKDWDCHKSEEDGCNCPKCSPELYDDRDVQIGWALFNVQTGITEALRLRVPFYELKETIKKGFSNYTKKLCKKLK